MGSEICIVCIRDPISFIIYFTPRQVPRLTTSFISELSIFFFSYFSFIFSSATKIYFLSLHEPHRRRDADQGRAPDLERADRVRHGLRTLQVPLDLRFGERALIDDAHGAGGGPGDGLDAHGHEPNAECGMRNAECKCKVEPRHDLPLKFRTPHSALRILVIPLFP